MGGSRHLCLPISSHIGQSGGEVTGLTVQQNYSDCHRVARHVLVLGPYDHVRLEPIVPAKSAPAVGSAIQ